uniref:Uncharacterized protein n=1 Tax=viral metagenome TaxID=1070528 RepID=A0A6M3XL74_9ZZZZ
MIMFVAGFGMLWCSVAKLTRVVKGESMLEGIFNLIASLVLACLGGLLIGIGAGLQ